MADRNTIRTPEQDTTSRPTPYPNRIFRFELPDDFEHAQRNFTAAADDAYSKGHQAEAVLRLLQFRFREQNGDNPISIDEVAWLVDLVGGTLPDPNQVHDQADSFNTAARLSLRFAIDHGETMEAIVKAMTTIAGGAETLEAISAAADRVYGFAQESPVYAPHWEACAAALVSRGFHVDIETISGYPPKPRVATPETKKAKLRTRRAIQSLVKAANRETAVNRAIPPH